MRINHFEADVRLRNVVKWYWTMELDIFPSVNHTFFPVGAVEIIFHLVCPFMRSGQNGWLPEKKAYIEGQQSGILRVKQVGPIKTIGITFYPWATHLLYKLSPKIFTDANFDIADVSNSLQDLYENLAETNGKDVARICDKYFLSHFTNDQLSLRPKEITIISLFKKTECTINIHDLKKQWNSSTRCLEKTFQELIGVSAGELTKKRRMQTALKRILNSEKTCLTDIAHSCGYYDQSHFIKDFKSYFLIKPTTFLKEENSTLKSFL